MVRLLELLGNMFNVKANPSRRLTSKEKAHKKRKQKLAKAARKRNRQKKK